MGNSSPRLASPSAHQRAVFEHVERSSTHAVVMATAGSGKTTTLVEVARRLPAGTRACFLAFNRSTAAELRSRLPSNVHATTIHALGRAALARHYPLLAGVPVDHDKYARLARETVMATYPGQRSGVAHELADHLAKVAGFARLELTDPQDLEAVGDLLPRYGIECPVTPGEQGELHALLAPIMRAGKAAAESGSVDLTDMVHLTVTQAVPVERYDFVCLDEAQDLSRMTLALVLRLVEKGARALFVGDPRQAIYAFAGAELRSLDRIRHATNAVVLPLSVSYRCPSRHVTLARRFAPEMSAAPGAEQGSVRVIHEARLARTASVGDLIMARVNAPLLSTSLTLAEAGTPVTILGVDLATEILDLARRVFPGRERLPSSALDEVRHHARTENRRLEAEFITSPRLATLQARNTDTHDALVMLIEATANEPAAGTREALTSLWTANAVPFSRLERLTAQLLAPGSVSNGVVLSTVHKAKGREADRVFLLRPEELGIGGADDDAVEANVLFVALTRAKRELVLVERHPGAIAQRLRMHAKKRPAGRLERDWDEVLRLALVMARAARGGLARRRARRA